MKILRIIGIIGALVLVGLWGYQLLGIGGNSDGSLLDSVPREEVTRQRVVSSLARLRAVDFSTSVLTNPTFTSLIENSRPLTPQPVGRSNPFAEVGTDAPYQPSSGTTFTPAPQLETSTSTDSAGPSELFEFIPEGVEQGTTSQPAL